MKAILKSDAVYTKTTDKGIGPLVSGKGALLSGLRKTEKSKRDSILEIL